MIHGGNVWQGGAPEKWQDHSANLRPEGVPEWVVQTVQKALSDMRYYPDLCMSGARRGLAAYAGVDERCILPTAGGIAAIDLALRLKSGPVRVERVTFGEYARRAAALGRCVSEETQPLPAGASEILCNPNNPSGGVRCREEVLALHEKARLNGGELIVDEAFIDYCPENSVRRDVSDTLTAVGSLTKILCIPGIRLGYVCASPGNIARLEKLALPWQLGFAAAAVAAELPGHLDEIRADAEKNAARREKLAKALEKLGAHVQPSFANFLFCQFEGSMAQCVERLRQHGILVRTCASFGLGDEYLRLAVRTEEENMRLIGEMKECLRS